ncbi:MAG TPA: class I SAM-dependent methyltransferase, partial [Leptolinea sp.]
IYFRWIIPLIGKIISGDRWAYTYLPHSTRSHLSADALTKTLQETGLESVDYRKMMFGTMAIHSGRKP